jgi:hypothetical protein
MRTWGLIDVGLLGIAAATEWPVSRHAEPAPLTFRNSPEQLRLDVRSTKRADLAGKSECCGNLT